MPHATTTLRFTAKLSKGQHRRLDDVLFMNRMLYNAGLEAWRLGYKRWLNRPNPNSEKPRQSYFDNCKVLAELRSESSEWARLHSNIGRGTLKRLERTIQRFYKSCKDSKPGYPRYKNRSRFRSIEIVDAKQSMLKPSETSKWWRLQIKGLPQIKFDGARLLKYEISDDTVKAIRLVKTPLRVELHIALAVPTIERSETAPLNPVGIDAGIKTRFALSVGEHIECRYHKRDRIKRRQRQLSRAKKGSKSRNKKREMLAKEHRRQKEYRRDKDYRIIACLLSTYDGFAVEALQIANMMRNHRLADSIAQQGWGDFTTRLKFKAEKAGFWYVEVNPAYTSQTCSRCGTRRDLPLKLNERTFVCYSCGFELDRDVNAAINICVQAFGLKSGGTMPPKEASPTRGAQISTVRLIPRHKKLGGDAVDHAKQYAYTQSG